jgi:hypothetical protein
MAVHTQKLGDTILLPGDGELDAPSTNDSSVAQALRLAACSVGNRQCIDFDEKAFTRQAGDHRRARRQHTAG